MKITVLSKNGAERTLTLTGSWRVVEGHEFNRLIGPGGTTYFFSSCGEYEGWGTKLFRAPERVTEDVPATRYRIFGERAEH